MNVTRRSMVSVPLTVEAPERLCRGDGYPLDRLLDIYNLCVLRRRCTARDAIGISHHRRFAHAQS